MFRIKILILISTIFILVFSINVSASNYNAYASVTSSTSNINMLIETMYNQEDFDLFKDWIGIRTDQNDYSVFYNIENGNVVRLRYYGTSSGYNTIWHLSKTIESNFSYYTDGYTIVGNTQDSLGVSSYREYINQFINTLCVPAILIIITFFVFRIRKRNRGLNI